MTVAVTTARLQYNGDGATTIFDVTFKYTLKAQIVVVHTDANDTDTTWVEGTQYTLSTPGDSGTVTVSTSPTDYTPASGERLTIYRLPAFTQAMDLTAGGGAAADTLEGRHDLTTFVLQYLNMRADLAMQLDIASGSTRSWDAGTRVIKNVTDPTNAQDAATKAYGDANWGGTAASNAAASATAAQTAQTASETAQAASEAAQLAAAASATAAAASAATAAGYAAGLNLPAIASGDANKILRVNSGETGYEHAAVGSGDMIAANNLSDLASASTARTNLGVAIGTDVQAQDAGLDSIAGLTTAADRMIYTTGEDTYAVATLTAAGRAILDDASASDQRTTLGLVIGTDVQAHDPGLASIAGLTTAADKMIYTTGSDTYAVADLTAAGRALIDDASASAQRTTLGLVIGTDVQAQNDILSDVAGLTQAADKGIYFDSASTAATFDLTSAGRALLDDASAAAQRTTLGLAALATLATVGTSQIDDESVTLAKLAHASAYTLLMNTAGSTGDPAYTKISGVTDRTAFGSGDKLLIEESTGELRKIDYDDLPGSGGGISNLVEDTTPQLGGMLDVNGQSLGDGTRELLTFTEDASAVNHINIENQATGSGPILSAAGDDTNVDLVLAGKGSGVPKIGSNAILNAGDIGSSVQAHDADTAKTDVAQEYSKAQNFNATTLTDAATISWNAEDNQVASVTLGGNRTLGAPTNLKDGGTYILTVKQDGTGSRTLAYNAVFKWPGGTAPALTTTASATDILTFVSDGTNMYGVSQLAFS